MSMNLEFVTTSGHHIDFPFQTPTELSYKVCAAKTTEERLQILGEYLKEHNHNSLGAWDRAVLKEVASMLRTPGISLVVV